MRLERQQFIQSVGGLLDSYVTLRLPFCLSTVHCRRRAIQEFLIQSPRIRVSQLTVDDWHESIGDPILADAILDWLMHNAHKLDLSGESIRKSKRGLTKPTNRE